MTDFVEWDALGRVVLLGLVLGAGLPTLFAVGVRALAGPGAVDATGRRPRPRLLAAAVSFGVIAAAIITAIVIIGTDGH